MSGKCYQAVISVIKIFLMKEIKEKSPQMANLHMPSSVMLHAECFQRVVCCSCVLMRLTATGSLPCFDVCRTTVRQIERNQLRQSVTNDCYYRVRVALLLTLSLPF